MAKTICVAASTASFTSTANTTQYFPIVGDKIASGTESVVQIPYRTPGKIYSFGIRIRDNSVSASTVFTLRQNGAGTALTFPVASTQTGWFEDVNHTVDVAAGDLLCGQSVPGSGSTGTFSYYSAKTEFDTTDSTHLTVTRIGSTVGSLNTGHTGASTSYYYQIHGATPTGTTVNSTESTAQTYQQYAAKLKNFGVKYTANSRTATTVRVRKNAGNSALVITVPASPNGTGWKEDLVNEETVAAADLFNYQITNGTGTSACSIFGMLCDYVTETDPGVGICHTGYVTVQTVAKATTNYIPIAGKYNGAMTTEVYTQVTVNDAYTFKGLTVGVTANAITGQSNVTLRVNTADSALTVPIAGSQTGTFSDLSHTVTVAAGDTVNHAIVGGAASGTVNISIKNVTVWTEIAGQTVAPVATTPTGKAVVNKFISHYP